MNLQITKSLLLATVAALALSLAGAAAKDLKLLNVSYDPTREFYADFNVAFTKHWQAKSGEKLVIQQSHGGSGKQARSVIDGLDADVVTLALAYDIDVIAEKARLLPRDWQKRLPYNSAPYTSTIVFLVRKGNPKAIRDWDDLVKPGVGVIPANPKTSGAARWTYLAAWGYALKKNNGNETSAKEFVARFYGNVPVFDTGARAATTTFIQREIGDVLVNWENEIHTSVKEAGPGRFEIITPSVSILAEPAVSLVDKVARKHGTEAVANDYLEYLYSDEGQDIAGRNFYRPRSEQALAKYASRFARVELFTIDQLFGGWRKAHQKHFADGGIFDQIIKK